MSIHWKFAVQPSSQYQLGRSLRGDAKQMEKRMAKQKVCKGRANEMAWQAKGVELEARIQGTFRKHRNKS